MAAEQANPFKVFYSYAHKDEKLRNELGKHLYPLKRQGLITDWYDRNISAGTEWEQEIENHLNTADIILLLISPDFMASEYCYSIEMQRALERHEAEEARVIPVILKPTDWQDDAFSKLQPLPKNGKPVLRWRSQGDGFVEVAKGLREVIKELPAPSPLPTIYDVSASSPTSPKSANAFEENQSEEPELGPVWNVPVSRNPFFTGRDQLLQHLHEMFTTDSPSGVRQPVVLSGIGGMGKTQTAAEYAYRYRDDYHVVLWARADSQETLRSDLASFADLLLLPGRKEQDQQYAMDAAKRWLEIHTNWLLILDNVEDIKMVYEFLPPKLQGHALLTSRLQVTFGKAKLVEVEKLNSEEGALLLLHRSGRLVTDASLDSVSQIVRTQAIEIADTLDGLPLAIDQAGAFIEETGASLAGYLEMYRKRRTQLLSLRGGLSLDHPEPVAATLSLSFEKVEQANSAAAELLRFFAFLHPDAIPDELIIRGAPHLSSLLQSIANDRFELLQAIGELYKYSLVRRNPDDSTLRLHRLVQAVLKDQMDEQMQSQWAERTIKAVNAAFPEVEFSNWQECQVYLPLAQVCSTVIEQWKITFPEAAELLYKAGQYLAERASYKEAETLLKQALTIYEQVLGPEHLDVATTLNELAEIQRKQGWYNEALPLYRRALTIREQVLGSEHPDVATSLNNLARPYQHLRQFTEAEPLYKRALAIRKQALGLNHPDTAQSLNDLATLYKEQDRYTQAEQLFKQALLIREQTLGPKHPDTAQSLQNLASFYRDQDRYSQAEQIFKQALSIDEQVLGPNHPDTAITLGNLAALYQDQGLYVQAEQLFKRVLAIDEQVLGSNAPATAINLNNLAALYQDQGLYVQAEQLFKRALAIDEQVLGSNSPNSATVLNNLAALYQDQGQYVQAEQLFKRALTIREQVLGPDSLDTVITLNRLGFLFQAQGQYTQAEQIFKRTLTIDEQTLGSNSPRMAVTLSHLGHLYQDQGQHIQAEHFLKQALTICEQSLGPSSLNTGQCLENLAILYAKQKHYTQAEELFQRALTIFERVLGLEHPKTKKILKTYKSFLLASGHRRRAAEIEIRLKTIEKKDSSKTHAPLPAIL